MATETLQRFEDYAIRLSQPYRSVVEFEVKVVAGESMDEPVGEWFYKDTSDNLTNDFDCAEMFLSGSIKWDGCSNWDFHTEEVMAHFCGREQATGIGRLLDHLYALAENEIGDYNEESE